MKQIFMINSLKKVVMTIQDSEKFQICTKYKKKIFEIKNRPQNTKTEY